MDEMHEKPAEAIKAEAVGEKMQHCRIIKDNSKDVWRIAWKVESDTTLSIELSNFQFYLLRSALGVI